MASKTSPASSRGWRDRNYAIAFYVVLAVHLSLCTWILVTVILNKDTYLKMSKDLPSWLRSRKGSGDGGRREKNPPAGGLVTELDPAPVDL